MAVVRIASEDDETAANTHAEGSNAVGHQSPRLHARKYQRLAGTLMDSSMQPFVGSLQAGLDDQSRHILSVWAKIAGEWSELPSIR